MLFAITMITAGFLVLLYPIVGNYLSNRERSQAELAYDQTMEETSEKEKKSNTNWLRNTTNTFMKSSKGRIQNQSFTKVF